MTTANANASLIPNMDPTVQAPMTNVAEYGFEGRFEDWADDARYFEYSKAANPIGSGQVPQVPIKRFGPETYLDAPTGVVPLDLSAELGIKTGAATSPRWCVSWSIGPAPAGSRWSPPARGPSTSPTTTTPPPGPCSTTTAFRPSRSSGRSPCRRPRTSSSGSFNGLAAVQWIGCRGQRLA